MTRRRAVLALFAALAAPAACYQAKPGHEATQDQGPPNPAAAALSASDPRPGPLVVFLGDSLTAGYQLGEAQAFPSLVAGALRQEGIPVRIVNAGVSGDTSAGGLRRLEWLLGQKPDVLVVALGANDGLRGQPLPEIERNLRSIAEKAKGAGARVLLVGMRMPTSYGPKYAEGFARIYKRLHRDLDVPLMPFLLDGVAGRPDLNLPDGIHPNARGQEIVAANVLRYLRPLLGPKG